MKPIVTLAGDHEVNQVFFDNVRTPVANRIGPENAGWTVAKYLLEFERGGDAYDAQSLCPHRGHAERIAREEASDGTGRLIEERAFAERLAEAEMEIQALGDDRDAGPVRPQPRQEPGRGLLGHEDPRQRDPAEARPSRCRGARLVCRAARARSAHARPQPSRR